MDKDLEVYIDADFEKKWDKEDSQNTGTAISRRSFVISYKGCPII